MKPLKKSRSIGELQGLIIIARIEAKIALKSCDGDQVDKENLQKILETIIECENIVKEL